MAAAPLQRVAFNPPGVWAGVLFGELTRCLFLPSNASFDVCAKRLLPGASSPMLVKCEPNLGLQRQQRERRQPMLARIVARDVGQRSRDVTLSGGAGERRDVRFVEC